jgi:hypothetical protein
MDMAGAAGTMAGTTATGMATTALATSHMLDWVIVALVTAFQGMVALAVMAAEVTTDYRAVGQQQPKQSNPSQVFDPYSRVAFPDAPPECSSGGKFP